MTASDTRNSHDGTEAKNVTKRRFYPQNQSSKECTRDNEQRIFVEIGDIPIA